MQSDRRMVINPDKWLVFFSSTLRQKRRDQSVINVRNPAGTSRNSIRCTACNHLGQASILPNSIKYYPTGWLQFDIGFLIARIVTLIWCLIGLIGMVALQLLNIEAPLWILQALIYCYVIALVASVIYGAMSMTPFDNCKRLTLVEAPAISRDRHIELPHIATADLTCSQCGERYPDVAITEATPKTADPFR